MIKQEGFFSAGVNLIVRGFRSVADRDFHIRNWYKKKTVMILFRQELVGETSVSPPATMFLRCVLFPRGEAALKVGFWSSCGTPALYCVTTWIMPASLMHYQYRCSTCCHGDIMALMTAVHKWLMLSRLRNHSVRKYPLWAYSSQCCLHHACFILYCKPLKIPLQSVWLLQQAACSVTAS